MLFNIPPPLTHAEHEKTPCWCLFVLGVFSTSTYACQTRKDTSVGVFSCSAPFHIHACTQNTKRHRFGVFSCSTHSFTYLCMPNTKRHQCWCLFVLGTCSRPFSVWREGSTPLVESFRHNEEACPLVKYLFIVKLDIIYIYIINNFI